MVCYLPTAEITKSDLKETTANVTNIESESMTAVDVVMAAIIKVDVITGLLCTGNVSMSNRRSSMHHPVQRVSVSFYHPCFLVTELSVSHGL